jgi:hypothetical protein
MKLEDAENTAGIYIVLMGLVLAITLLSSCSVAGDISERVSQSRADRAEVRAEAADQAIYDAEHTL